MNWIIIQVSKILSNSSTCKRVYNSCQILENRKWKQIITHSRLRIFENLLHQKKEFVSLNVKNTRFLYWIFSFQAVHIAEMCSFSIYSKSLLKTKILFLHFRQCRSFWVYHHQTLNLSSTKTLIDNRRRLIFFSKAIVFFEDWLMSFYLVVLIEIFSQSVFVFDQWKKTDEHWRQSRRSARFDSTFCKICRS